jgi:NosR/NirI family nitrous oxide reductase transcriptional regulator
MRTGAPRSRPPPRHAHQPAVSQRGGLRLWCSTWQVVFWRALVALIATLVLAAPRAAAGTLDKAAVEAMFPPPWLVGERLAHLPVWPVYTRNGQTPELRNYVFETIDLEPVAGYGGRPINVLVVMDRDGAYVTSRLLSHMEPIFRSESGTAVLARFAAQYQGVTVNHQVQVLTPKAERVVTPTMATLHGIVAGTVTANAINRGVMESAAQVAQAAAQASLADMPGAAATKGHDRETSDGPNDRYQRTGFNGLAAAGLLQPWAIEHRLLEQAFRGTPGAGRDAEGTLRPRAAGVDLWLSFVGIPQAGRNLLDAARWREVREMRERGEPVLMVLDGGRYALRDPTAADEANQARGATLQLAQGGRSFTLEPLAWERAGMRMSGQHSGVSADARTRFFRVRDAADGTRLDVLAPVELKLDAWRRTAQGAAATAHFDRAFEIPDAAQWAPVRETPKWLEPWGQRRPDLAATGAALALLAVALVAQRRTAASAATLAAFRIPFLLFTLVFVGWIAQGQLTIVSLTSMIEALVGGRALDFLLADPMAVVLWLFTFATLVIWGRGTFCGWLCPFGALQELVAIVARKLGIAQRRLRVVTDRWLKSFKYVVLALVLAAAVLSPELSEQVVEVEPFKTAISLHFQRSWPYVAWALACLALGVVVYRGYCRYICPLGAALAILGRLRLWRWIPRRAQCGTPCQTCRHACDYQAIAPSGKVDYAECFQCLDCVQVHDDATRCLPLVAARNGKVIPIRAVTLPVPAPALDSAIEAGVR